MNLNENFERINGMSSEEIKKNFSLKDLYKMYIHTERMETINEEFFEKYIKDNQVWDKKRIEGMWKVKGNILKLKEILIKSISYLERQQIITHQEQLSQRFSEFADSILLNSDNSSTSSSKAKEDKKETSNLGFSDDDFSLDLGEISFEPQPSPNS